MCPPRNTLIRGIGGGSGNTEPSKGILAANPTQNCQQTCSPSSPFIPAVPGMPVPAIPYKESTVFTQESWSPRLQNVGFNGATLYPGDREHARLGPCLGGNTVPESRNHRGDLPLSGNKRMQRMIDWDGDGASIQPRTNSNPYKQGEKGNGGRSQYASPHVYLPITLSQLFLADGFNKYLSNDLFSPWSRQSRNTVWPHRAWQARFPLKRKIQHQIFLFQTGCYQSY